jgi:hypothetical protein
VWPGDLLTVHINETVKVLFIFRVERRRLVLSDRCR